MKNIFTTLILVFYIMGNLFSQYDTLCRSDITNYLKKSFSDIQSDEDQNCYFDYSVNTIFNTTTSLAPQKINFKVYSTKKILVIESDLISVYVDQNDSYIIMHDQKLISRGDGAKNPPEKHYAVELFTKQLQLINSSTLTKCFNINEDNKNCRLTVFKLSEDILKSQNIASLEVLFNLDEKQIYKVVMNYDQNSQIKRQTITYNIINYNYQVKLQGTAREHVLGKNSKLLPKYKGYTLL